MNKLDPHQEEEDWLHEFFNSGFETRKPNKPEGAVKNSRKKVGQVMCFRNGTVQETVVVKEEVSQKELEAVMSNAPDLVKLIKKMNGSKY